MKECSLRLELRFSPDWDRIEAVRRAVCFAMGAVFSDPSLEDAVGMVASELLENAVKYGKPDGHVSLSVSESPDIVTVSVTNDVPTQSPKLHQLHERLSWLKTFDHPQDAYAAALLAAYDNGSEGGLGLVRVAYEGRCSLSYETSTTTVTVTASRRIRRVSLLMGDLVGTGSVVPS